MGRYIETKNALGKASQLLQEFPEITKLAAPKFTTDKDNVTVCVVENGPFDAAAVAYDGAEYVAFNDPSDWRAKTWLNVPRCVLTKLIDLGRCPADTLSLLPQI